MDEKSLPRLLDPETIKKEFFNGVNTPNLNLPAIYGLFKRDDFPGLKIGRKWFVPTNLFIEWLENQARTGGKIA
jgi:hypothetical protein